MAILASLNLLSEQRLDISSMRRIESAVRNDFDEMTTSIFTGTSQGYVIRGFSILTAGAIGSPANGLQMVVDNSAILNINASVSGTIFQTPLGTPNQTLNAATNTNVSGSFTANSTNYVGIDYNRFADSSTNVTKFIWNAASNDEIETIAPESLTLTYKIYITTSVWAANVLPIAKVTTDGNGNVTSVSDCRWNLYSLETGGINPDPNHVYPWSQGRTQSPVTTTSNSIDPFIGGDKQLACFKDWADAVMSTFLEVKGTPYWFSGVGSGTLPSLLSLLQDLGNTVITGSGEISNGILPNSSPILVTTGSIVLGSDQLTSLGSVAGLAVGDPIFGTGIVTGTVIESIVGSTVTMSRVAALNGTGIGVSFYTPGVITAPGQINWDKDIQIRVIGSSLTYTLAANPSSTNISLSDDQVAYITFVREAPITPNLIFVSGSPVVTSVGNVLWTSAVVAGDYIKIASNPVSDYYKILSVSGDGHTVTLTTNVLLADNTGVAGAPAQYAFGSYTTSATPSTTRNIYIASRALVPAGGNVFWLFMREDNGGDPRVYIRFLSQELDNGESVEVSGTTSIELLEYIGSPSAAASKPQYVSALNPGALPQIENVTVASGSVILAGQYFLINSAANARQYAVWFKVNGVGSAPVVPNINSAMEVDILSSDSAITVASKLASAFNTGNSGDFYSLASSTGQFIFTVTAANATAGATYTNNGQTFTVVNTIVGGTTLVTTGTGAPTGSGTLTKVTGTGNATITFSAFANAGTLTVTNTSAGATNAAANGSLTAPFTISASQSGSGTGNYIIHDGDSLTLAVKELDKALGDLFASLDSPTYDETVNVVASGATPPTSITGPISPGTNITLPNNTREGNIAQQYTVGKGTLMVFLNGQFIDVESAAYTEVGASGAPSSQIQIQISLSVGDELEFRLGGGGGGGGGGGVGPAGPTGPAGAPGPAGADAAGGPVSVSTKTGNYTVLTSDCFLAANCTTGAITFTLPTAAGNTGRIFYFKKLDNSVNALTIVGTGGQSIDGIGTFVLGFQNQAVSMISNGSFWWIF